MLKFDLNVKFLNKYQFYNSLKRIILNLLLIILYLQGAVLLKVSWHQVYVA